MPATPKTALVVGASRGLGLGLVKQYLDRGWHVVATERAQSGPLAALKAAHGDALTILPLDVVEEDGIAALRRALSDKSLDLLFVSAGIGDRKALPETSQDEFVRIMLVNALAPMRIIEALGDRVADAGVVAAMSSVLGSVGSNTSGGYDAYRASKAALNTLLRSYFARHSGRSIVALHPGWVRTDMGGANANIDVAESVAGMVTALDGRAGKAGCVFLDYQGKTIVW